MKNRILMSFLFFGIFCIALTFTSCTPSETRVPAGPVSGAVTAQRPVVAAFFQDFGKTSAYGGDSNAMLDFKQVQTGKASLKVKLNSAQWAAVMLQLPEPADLSGPRNEGAALSFWIKCKGENQPLRVQMVDSNDDGKPVEIALDLRAYTRLWRKWEQVVIPLSYFPDRGDYWDGVEHQHNESFQWNSVSEVRFQVAPSEKIPPPTYEFNVDEVIIVK